MSMGKDSRSIDPGRGQRWLTVLNMSGEVIPAWSALEPYGVNGDGAILVRKPTVDDSPIALLGNGQTIGIGDYGVGTNQMATWAYFHAADGTPAVGESLGTRSGQWKLYRGYEGFLVWGGSNSYAAGGSIIMVQRDVTCRALTGGNHYYYDGISRLFWCCNCERFRCQNIVAEPPAVWFPDTLSSTMTVGCIGTKTVTLDKQPVDAFSEYNKGCLSLNPHITYSYFESTVAEIGDEANYTACNGNPVSVGVFTRETFGITIQCCESTGDGGDNCTDLFGPRPLYKWTYFASWEKLTGTDYRAVSSWGNMNLISCSPLSLSVTGTIACPLISTTPPIGNCGAYDTVPNVYETLMTACSGSSFQLDADE